MSVRRPIVHRAPPARIGRGDRRWLAAWSRMRGAVIASTLGIVAVAGAGSGWLAVSAWRDNQTIAALAAGRDLSVGAGAPAAVRFARADFLLARERIDEAQALVVDMRLAGDHGRLADLQYNIANARLRAAFGLFEENRIDAAIPLIRLAKDGYRAALTVVPDHWDARHNLDVAMRLVRDLPRNSQDEEDAPPEPPKQLWTDLPGLPKGLP
jgi:mxaK protein